MRTVRVYRNMEKDLIIMKRTMEFSKINPLLECDFDIKKEFLNNISKELYKTLEVDNDCHIKITQLKKYDSDYIFDIIVSFPYINLYKINGENIDILGNMYDVLIHTISQLLCLSFIKTH